MMKNSNNHRPDSETIIRAVKYHDNTAIEEIIAFYQGYICSIAKREMIMSNGERVKFIDEELKQRMENKLRQSIFKFRI